MYMYTYKKYTAWKKDSNRWNTNRKVYPEKSVVSLRLKNHNSVLNQMDFSGRNINIVYTDHRL